MARTITQIADLTVVNVVMLAATFEYARDLGEVVTVRRRG
jgi:hypothetical protein